MKTMLSLATRLFMFTLLTFSLQSCDKDDDETPNNNNKVVKTGIPLQASQETTPVVSTGSGTVDVDYDKTTNVLMYTATWTGLTSNANNMHFHGPATRGVNAPPVVPVTGFPTQPAGSIHGTATLTAEQETDFLAGKWYYNVHSVTYPGGELRGQIEF